MVSSSASSCISKALLEHTLNIAQEYTSDYSHFLHYIEGASEGMQRDGIACATNFFYALALIKTHQQEKVLLAKSIISSLLEFQIRQEKHSGAYPLYLHQYPLAYSKRGNLDIALIQLMLLANYKAIFKEEERKKLEASLRGLVKHFSLLFKDNMLSSLSALKFYYILSALNKHLAFDTEELATLLYDQLSDQEPAKDLLEQEAIAEWMCFAFIDPDCKQPELAKRLYPLLSKCWDTSLSCFTGPARSRQFKGHESLSSFLSLVMQYRDDSQDSHNFKGYVLEDLLRAVGLFPVFYQGLSELELKNEATAEFSWGGFTFFSWPSTSICYQEYADQNYLYREKTFYPLKLEYFSGSHKANLVVQSYFHLKDFNYSVEDLSCSFKFEIEDSIDELDAHLPLFSLFFSYLEGSKVLVNEKPASCFTLNDDIFLKSKDKLFKVSFLCSKENDCFLGHVKLGNRKGQLLAEGRQTPLAYDWQVYLRNLGLQTGDIITVKLELVG
ncbi:MAG: hypothetical protein GWP59_03950 [Chlamydiales bacterium]|nr:hypothetical protein [Chlamydiales bacterium]